MNLRARALLGVVTLSLVSTCAKPAAAVKVKVEEAPRDERTEVIRALKNAYAAIEEQDPLKLKPLLTPDVMAFGLGPADTFSERETLLDRIRQNLLSVGLREEKLKIVTREQVVGLSSGKDSAWVYDAPKVELTSGAKTEAWLPRITAHAIRSGDTWKFDAMHVSLGIDDAKLYAPDATKRYLPPGDVLGERGPDADQVVGLTKRLLEDLAVKIDKTSDRAEVVLIGTDPAEVFIGGSKFKALVKPRLPEIKRSVFTLKIEGPLRAHVAASRKTGWVAANVVLRLGKKPQVLPPFRTLWVFEDSGDEQWRIVQEHQSLALKTELREPATPQALAAWAAAVPPAKVTRDAGAPDAGEPDAPPIGVW